MFQQIVALNPVSDNWTFCSEYMRCKTALIERLVKAKSRNENLDKLISELVEYQMVSPGAAKFLDDVKRLIISIAE